ncbi:MAG: helix-hairpin-helix domain-containing protein [Actinomycetota bacterium]
MEGNFADRLKGIGRASPSELVLLVLLAISIVGGSALVFIRRSEPPAPPIQRASSKATASSRQPSSASPAPSKTLLVHVAGLVTTPGVYELADGSRVKDAVAAAGGPKPEADTNALNLAAVLSDGQKVVVVAPGQVVAEQGAQYLAGSGSGGATAAKVNLNAATQAELETLPSIGPVIAQRILTFRQQKGKFTSVKQLQDVSGVGPKKFEGLKDLVTV